METVSLDALAREHLDQARAAGAGRSAVTIFGGHEHAMRQTLIALRSDASLDEHENPGEATVQVLAGRIRVTSGDQAQEVGTGELLVIPDARHGLTALEDSVVLLSAVPRGHIG